MSDVNITLGLTDGGSIKQTTEQAVNLKNQLNSVEQQAVRTSSAIKQAYARPAQNAYQSAGVDTGMGRGTTGAGGGDASKDFARQAQGLGGLVHVYATFAANLFAVSAAFTALSKAADVENLTKGMDQLAVSSGRGLSAIAKQVKEATDGALSMKQAMQATLQANAGGLTGEQFTRITAVAKNAALALGRELPDAIERLTLGIVKSQPKLLDELGIVMHVGIAHAEYAKSIGKSALALTEFERSQSFAIAAIKQGELKFGTINMEANPYSKLLASMTDLGTAGLKLLNTVLGPIAKMLADSPMALALVMGGIATMLVNKAIPALGHWREELAKTAEQAANTAKRAAEAHELFQINKEVSAGQTITAPIEKEVSEGISKIQTQLVNTLGKGSALVANSIADNFSSKLGIEIAKYDALGKSYDKQISNRKEVITDTKDENRVKLLQEEIVLLEKKKFAMQEIQTVALATLANQTALHELEAKQDLKSSTGGWEEKLMKARADSLQNKAQAAAILSNVGSNTQIMGMADAWRTMRDEIKYGTVASQQFRDGGMTRDDMMKSTAGVRGMTAAWTTMSGTVRIAATTFMTAVSALGNVFMAIGIIGGAFEMLDFAFSKNSKQIGVFKSSMEALEGVTDTLGKTTELYAKKDPTAMFSVTAIQAKATAVSEISSYIGKTLVDYEEAMKKASLWDKTIDFYKILWSGDSRDKLAEHLSNALGETLQSVEGGPAKDKFTATMKNILKPASESTDDWSRAMTAAVFKDSPSTLKAISTAWEELTRSESNAASTLTSMVDELKTLKTAQQTLTTSFMPNDAASKWGMEQIAGAQKLALALQDPKNALIALNDIVSSSENMSLFSPKQQSQMLAERDNIQSITKDLTTARKGVSEYEIYVKNAKEQLVKDLKTPTEDFNNEAQLNLGHGGNTVTAQEVSFLEQTLATYKSKIVEAQRAGSKELALGAQLAVDTFKDGFKFVIRNLETASTMAANNLAKAALAAASGPGVEQIRTDLQVQEINVQKQLIQQEIELIKTQKELGLKFEAGILIQEHIKILDEKKSLLEDNAAGKISQPEFFKSSVNLRDRDKSNVEAVTSNLKAQEQLAKLPNNLEGLKDGLKDINKDLAVFGSISNTVYAMIGAQVKLIGFNSQENIAKLQGVFNVISATAKKEQEGYLADQKSLDTKTKVNDLQIQIAGGYDDALTKKKEELVLEKNLLAIKERESQQHALEQTMLYSLATTAQVYAKKGGEKSAEYQKAMFDWLNVLNTKAAENAAQAQTDEATLAKLRFDDAMLQITYMNKIASMDNAHANSVINLEITRADTLKNILENEKTLGKINDEEHGFQLRNLDLEIQSYEYSKKSADIKTAINASESEYQGRLVAIGVPTQRMVDDHTRDLRVLEDQKKELDAQNQSIKDKINLTYEVTKAQATWLPFYQEVKQGLTDALLAGFEAGSKNGGKVFIDTLTKSLKTAAFKVVVNAIINPITGQISNMTQGMVNGMSGAASSMISGATSGLVGSTLSGAFGSSGAGFGFSAGLANTAAGATTMSSIEGAAAASEWATLAGEVVPYIGAIVAGVAILKSWLDSPGGPKTGGSATFHNGNVTAGGSVLDETQLNSQMITIMKNFSTGLEATITKLGGVFDKGMTLTLGVNSDLAGTALDMVASKVTDALGNTIYNPNVNTNVARGGAAAEAQVELQRMTLAAINASAGIPKIFKDIIGGIDLVSASSSDLTATLQKLNDTFSLTQAFKALNWNIDKLTTTFIDASGGAAGLASALTNYYQTFYSDIERQVSIKKQVQGVFDTLKISMPTTLIGFRTLVEQASNDLTDTGRTTFNALLNVSSAFATLTDVSTKSISELMNSVNAFYAKQFKAKTGLDITLKDQISNLMSEIIMQTQSDVKAKGLPVTEQNGAITTQAQVMALQSTTDLTGSYDKLSETSKGLVTQIYDLIAAQKAQTDGLNLKLLTAQGDTLGALVATRQKEMAALSDTDKLIQQQIYIAEDKAKTDQLNVDLMTAQGKANEVLAITRQKELAGLDVFDQVIKKKIYDMQDYTAYMTAQNNLWVNIYNALGDSESALAITRAAELAALDARLIPAQEYLYAVQDEASLKARLTTAYNAQTTAIKTTIDALTNSAKALRDYRDQLRLGDKANLSPIDQYKEAQTQLQSVFARATSAVSSNPLTDAEKAAVADKQDALSKLPQIADSFLSASQGLYASSAKYTTDKNSVLNMLDQAATLLDSQRTDAQSQIDAIDKGTDILKIIQVNTEDTATVLQKYLLAQAAVQPAKETANWATVGNIYQQSLGRAADFSGQSYWADKLNTGAATLDSIQSEIVTSAKTWLDQNGGIGAYMNMYGQDAAKILGRTLHLPGYAMGGFAHGLSLVGENGPEIVDFKTPGQVYSNNQTRGMLGNNQALINEMKALRAEVAELRKEQNQQTGHLIAANYDSVNKSAEKIAVATKTVSDTAEWRKRSAAKVA